MIVEMSSQIQAEVGSTTEIPATLVFDYPRMCELAEFLVASFRSDWRATVFGRVQATRTVIDTHARIAASDESRSPRCPKTKRSTNSCEKLEGN